MKAALRFKLMMLAGLIALAGSMPVLAGNEKDKDQKGFQFTTVTEVKTTPVKNQARTGTCWSFATTSFLETEILRLGGESLDLSEMFNVRQTYPLKAQNYVRLHGNTVFGSGSLAQDVLRVVRNYGMVPEAVYNGMHIAEPRHNHGELHTALKGFMDGVIKNRGRKVTPVWPRAVDAILDVYLGRVPASFEYDGQSYTPKTFAAKAGINPDDYVELTSFTHHPFYAPFSLEIPDNWARNISYNVPLDELLAVFDNALHKGYSIAWDGDVSERSFKHKKGVAILPLKDWDDKTEAERKTLCDAPEPEKNVTQVLRQQGFDNYTSTDDHLMHIIGLAKDQNGTKYYRTKNSWGAKNSKYNGYVYMSEPYVRAKTISILVHRDAVPKKLLQKLHLK